MRQCNLITVGKSFRPSLLRRSLVLLFVWLRNSESQRLRAPSDGGAYLRFCRA